MWLARVYPGVYLSLSIKKGSLQPQWITQRMLVNPHASFIATEDPLQGQKDAPPFPDKVTAVQAKLGWFGVKLKRTFLAHYAKPYWGFDTVAIEARMFRLMGWAECSGVLVHASVDERIVALPFTAEITTDGQKKRQLRGAWVCTMGLKRQWAANVNQCLVRQQTWGEFLSFFWENFSYRQD